MTEPFYDWKNMFRGQACLMLALCVFLLLPLSAAAQNPYAKPDNTWLTLSGKIASVSPDSFVLDYGNGTITVEMDDGDRDADAYQLEAGDQVTVSGMIDDDFFEKTSLEAGSVHVEKLGTTFFASSLDEEDYPVIMGPPAIMAPLALQGTVSEVGEQEFTLNTFQRRLTVDVREMPYNPLDDEGYQKIEVGDFVKVTGSIDDNLFGKRQMAADSVLKLNR